MHAHGRSIFGAGERLFDEGDDLDGVYFVVSGTVSLQMVKDGQASEIATIKAGEFCGETGMHGHQAAEMRAVALEDTAVVLIAPDVVRHLFETSARLARETGYTLEVHRKALQSARTHSASDDPDARIHPGAWSLAILAWSQSDN